MSVEIDWNALTGGSEGCALAEAIRAFVHERFQQITLPRFIQSVKVHAFDFGSVAPELELKDVCDPLPDFYDEAEDGSDQDNAGFSGSKLSNVTSADNNSSSTSPLSTERERQKDHDSQLHRPPTDTNSIHTTLLRSTLGTPNPFLARSSTPGIPGGTSNMGYFHLPLSAGISGAATPLATAVGAQFGAGWPEYFHPSFHGSNDDRTRFHGYQSSVASQPSINDMDEQHGKSASRSETSQDTSADDVQIVMHLKYSGDVKLSLTAEILLDFPMPSFVGIPLRLTVTGLTFDGVAILAYVKRKAHFCFLAPEDADAFVGINANREDESGLPFHSRQGKQSGVLFEEIKVESEIGQKTNGKQVLKNVGKVEKFVLEQVRGIFESEFVYPSFWTFLV